MKSNVKYTNSNINYVANQQCRGFEACKYSVEQPNSFIKLEPNWYSVMLESTFVKVCDLYPLTFPKIHKARKFSKIIASAVQTTAFVPVVCLYFGKPITNIRSFADLLAHMIYIISTPVNLFYIFNPDFETVNFYLLQDSDEAWASVKKTESKFFCIVVGLVAMYWVSLASLLSFRLILSTFVAAGETFAMYQLASLKLMTSKRFRCILDEVRKGKNIVGLLPAVRNLSDINVRINQTYSLKSLVALAYHFGPYITSLTAFWEIYGPQHKHTGTWEENYPFLAFFITFQILFLLGFLGYSTNKYAEMVRIISKCIYYFI